MLVHGLTIDKPWPQRFGLVQSRGQNFGGQISCRRLTKFAFYFHQVNLALTGHEKMFQLFAHQSFGFRYGLNTAYT